MQVQYVYHYCLGIFVLLKIIIIIIIIIIITKNMLEMKKEKNLQCKHFVICVNSLLSYFFVRK